MELAEAPVVGQLDLLPDGIDAPYWEGLARGELRIQRCNGCSSWIWGPQCMCPECQRPDPGWESVNPRGVVYSWIRTWQKFAPEFASLVPYVTVLVELPDAGNRRVLGLLLGDDHVAPKIGEPVVGVIQPPSELTSGVPVLRWQRAGRGPGIP